DENQIVPKSDTIREELLWMMTHDDNFINAISGSGTDSKEKTIEWHRISYDYKKTQEKILANSLPVELAYRLSEGR
ncbi:MAG: hypothetical protein NC821_05975, partial [Candidatus Omnitrophica bacterium]|nr:hypothetical protein [Candidatus Omnitrophota bacterium]